MVYYLQDRILAQQPHIGHAFFTREGGVSMGDYAGLNACFHRRDLKENVLENRRLALATLGKKIDQMTLLSMQHGSHVIVLDKTWEPHHRLEGDALITQEKGIILTADTADCPVILLAEPTHHLIALIHAGWKSARAQIIPKTIKKMVALGAHLPHIIAVIGPCIMQESYEVDGAFYQNFLEESPTHHLLFTPSRTVDHYYFDLLGYVYQQLSLFPCQSITAIGIDTYRHTELFFSCRRAYHQKTPDFGGHLSCIYLKE